MVWTWVLIQKQLSLTTTITANAKSDLMQETEEALEV